MQLKNIFSLKVIFIILTLIFFCISSNFYITESCCFVRITRWYGWPLSYAGIGREFDSIDFHERELIDHGSGIDLLRDGWEFQFFAPDGSSQFNRPFPFDSTFLSIIIDLLVGAIFSVVLMSFVYVVWFVGRDIRVHRKSRRIAERK